MALLIPQDRFSSFRLSAIALVVCPCGHFDCLARACFAIVGSQRQASSTAVLATWRLLPADALMVEDAWEISVTVATWEIWPLCPHSETPDMLKPREAQCLEQPAIPESESWHMSMVRPSETFLNTRHAESERHSASSNLQFLTATPDTQAWSDRATPSMFARGQSFC